MPRPSIVELRAQIAALFPDNTSGAIDPSELRTYLLGALDAIAPAYGVLSLVGPSNQTANITPPVKMVWGAAQDNGGQTTSNFAAGTVARSERGTATINFTTDFEAAANRFVTFALYKNNVATPWRTTGNGGGAGNPIAVALTAIDYSDPAATYDIRMTAEVAGVVVTLTNAALVVAIDPVNTY